MKKKAEPSPIVDGSTTKGALVAMVKLESCQICCLKQGAKSIKHPAFPRHLKWYGNQDNPVGSAL